MRIFIIFLCIFLNSGNFYCQLIRPNFIYENVIKGVHDHYNNTCIILLHVTENPIEGQGIRESQNLLNLQLFFSRAYIPTTITSIDTFVDQIGDSYLTMVRPLFVLLNDDDDLRQQFVREIAPALLNYHTWLIFLREETPIQSFFEDIYVKFDSSMMVSQPDGNISSPGEIITEVYKINRGDQLRSSLLGTWNQEMGIKLSQLSLYQRRNDLQGRTLRVTCLKRGAESTIIRNHNRTMIGLGGYTGELMDILQESMNFTILYQEAYAFVETHENGSQSGALKDIYSGRTDIIANVIPMTSARLTWSSYSTQLHSAKIRVYIKRPGPPTSNWNAYFIPFEPNVWIAIVVTIVIITITMFLVNSAISLFASHWKDNEEISTNVPDIFFRVFGVFCSQGMVASILDPIRIIHFVIHLTAVIIITAYSADMISALTVPTFVMPFTTLEGLLQDGTYRFGVEKYNVLYQLFRNSTNKIDRAIFNKFLLKEENLVEEEQSGFKRVCDEDKYAFMDDEMMALSAESSFGCPLVPLNDIIEIPAAFILTRYSPYLGIINSHLLKLRDSGILQRISNTHFAKTGDNVDEGLESVGIKNILPLLVLLAAGVFMSLMILGIEKLLKRNEKIIKKEKKIVKKFLKNIKPPLTQKNHLYPFYN